MHKHSHGHHRHCGHRFARRERGFDGADFGPRGHGHHHRNGSGRGLGRFFAQGDLRLVILHLIAEQPRHGYELIKAIEDKVGGAYSPSPGVIYPTLTLLEEMGLVSAEAAEGARRRYAITAAGQDHLAAQQPAVQALLARMEEAGRATAGGPPAPLLRAMENLRLALRLRLSRGPLTDEQAHAIAAALDAAATAVERA